jgi:DNA polymerase-3 subunit alpha (Gram-positive type)
MAGKGFEDSDQAPLYYRTTDEMLDEFEYLGKEKAYEVVVTNSNLIADMCQNIRPSPKNRFPDCLPNAKEELQELSGGVQNEIYGDPLRSIVFKEWSANALNYRARVSAMYTICAEAV